VAGGTLVMNPRRLSMSDSGIGAVTAVDPVGSVTAWSPIYGEARDSVYELAEAMTADNFGALLIRMRDDHVAIVTERDIVHTVAAGTEGQDWAADVMTREVLSVSAETSIAEVAELMLDANIRHMLVTDNNGDRMGIASIRDLVGPLLVSAG